MAVPLNVYTSPSKSAKSICIDADTAEETGWFIISWYRMYPQCTKIFWAISRVTIGLKTKFASKASNLTVPSVDLRINFTFDCSDEEMSF
jgi:hypothetical protein